MQPGLVRKIDIDREMQQAYLDYAMSTIVARALPDARDGLKPVHRRILYAMYDMGLRPDSPYKKSARIVGEVLGKYHPHGDAAVYEAMARMAQDFSMRVLLVDGQGNFGSIDGDPPAAMRYTEARLTAAALEMLADLNKNTVDFGPNFDDTLQEPLVLPAALPNLLVNGATGIAVGMATSIPPHNLGEVVDALVYLLRHWEKLDDIGLEHLMQFIQGPDFPTGGVILQEAGEEGIEAAYGSGKGKITLQARAHYEEMERGKSRIIVTELPYQVNKASLIERIAELAREGHLEGLADLRDESDRQGMRIVIELTKNADPETVLAELYKRTPMRVTFSIILLALVEGEPRLLTLKQALRVYLEHRLTVIRRRAEYDLEKARARAHVLEGYLIALQNLDEIIELIKKSPDAETARERLMKRYKLTEIQANAILEMQLRRLAALERKKIETEYKEVTALIKELEALLQSPQKMRALAAEELLKVKAAYGEPRRTQVVNLKAGKEKKSALTAIQLLPEQPVWVAISAEGQVIRTRDEKPPRLAGGDAPKLLVRARATDTLYLVSERGVAAAVAVHTLPEGARLADGAPFHRLCALKAEDRPAAAFVLPAKRARLPETACILTVTRGGMLKKSLVSELPGPSAQTFPLCKVNEGDALGWVLLTDGRSELLLVTAQGMAIRFSEDEIRPMGLAAAGVNGIKLAVGDQVTGAAVLKADRKADGKTDGKTDGKADGKTDRKADGKADRKADGKADRKVDGKADEGADVFLVCSNGKARRVALEEFPLQGRYGKGVIAWELPPGVTLAGMTVGAPAQSVTLHLRKAAARQIRLEEAGLKKRAAMRGDAVVDVPAGDAVVGLTAAWMLEESLPASGEAAPTGQAAQLPLLEGQPANGKSAARAKTRAGKANKTAETKAVSAGKPPRGRKTPPSGGA